MRTTPTLTLIQNLLFLQPEERWFLDRHPILATELIDLGWFLDCRNRISVGSWGNQCSTILLIEKQYNHDTNLFFSQVEAMTMKLETVWKLPFWKTRFRALTVFLIKFDWASCFVNCKQTRQMIVSALCWDSFGYPSGLYFWKVYH